MILDYEWKLLDSSSSNGAPTLGCSFRVHRTKGKVYDIYPTTVYYGAHTNGSGIECYRGLNGNKLNITHYMILPKVGE
jgi:hypothetical protein